MQLGKFLEEKGSDKLAIVAVVWLESLYGADAGRLDRVIRREISPAIAVVQGTEATSQLFGGIESVPAFFLYDRTGRQVLSRGGPREEQSRNRVDRAALEAVIAP